MAPRPRAPAAPPLPLPLLLAAAAVVALAPRAALGCTSVIVGKGATEDGSLYLARTVDFDDPLSTNNLRWHAAREAPATFRSSQNGFEARLPAPGLAYLAAPSNLAGGAATLEEVGHNERGLVVSATETIHPSAVAAEADPPNAWTGINEDAIPSLLLPQAGSARAAAQLLGRYIERHGAAEGFGVLLGDTSGEAWYLESGAGTGWLAQRVPDDAVFVSANQGRLQGANLSDPSAALAADGLLDWARESGLWDPHKDGPFDFSKAVHQHIPADASANHPRVAAVQARLGCLRHGSGGGRAPVFVPPCPGGKLGALDVMDALRDHYNGTDQDTYALQQPTPYLTGEAGEPPRPVANLATGFAHVTRIRAGLPPGLAVLHYFAPGPPAWMPHIPVHAGLSPQALPKELQGVGYGRRPDGHSLFWRGRRLAALVFQDWPLLGPAVEAAVRQADAETEAALPAAEAAYRRQLAAGDAAAAGAELATFTRQAVDRAAALLDRLQLEAREALGLTGDKAPDDATLADWLLEAAKDYAFNWG